MPCGITVDEILVRADGTIRLTGSFDASECSSFKVAISGLTTHKQPGVIKSDGSGDRYLSFLPITIPIPIREAALLEPTWSWHFPVSTNNQTILVFLESHNDERFQFPRNQ